MLRKLSTKWNLDRQLTTSDSSSRGAAVPYDPTTADDNFDASQLASSVSHPFHDDVIKEYTVDDDNNEVFSDVSQMRSNSSSSGFPVTRSGDSEILSVASLMLRAKSVDPQVGHVTNGIPLVNGNRRIGRGTTSSAYGRSVSLGQGRMAQGHQDVFAVNREMFGSLAESGDAERLQAVLKIDNEAVNGADEVGNTALHKAAAKGHSRAAKVLLLFGADMELKNLKGDDAMSLAVENGHCGVVAQLSEYMMTYNKRPQDPYVLLRARPTRVTSLNSYVIERVKSCCELKSFRRRNIDFIHLLVCQGQKVNELNVFFQSVLDVPVGHAHIVNGHGAELTLSNFQRFDGYLDLRGESVTVLGTRLRAMNAGKFQQLRSLVLVDCNLSELVLDSLDCLEILDVRRNRLTSLPPSIGRCRRLETLRVASNELRHLPGRELGGLNKLTALDCSFNKLKRFPIYLVQCIELTILECNDNGLVELPVDIGLLLRLEELLVHNNHLSQLPVSISSLTRLRRLSFGGNPLTNIPLDFPQRASGVRQYLQSLQEDPVANNTVKLIVVGQEGVGKTCLLKALRRTSWILPQGSTDSRRSTEGVDIRDIKLNDVTLRCFDCCGDVDFNESHNFFMTRGAIYLVCFNLAEYCSASVERESFLLGRLQLWLQYIFTKVPDARVLIVGTHADHPGLTRTTLELIWDLLRLLFVDARDHHHEYFLDDVTAATDSDCGREDNAVFDEQMSAGSRHQRTAAHAGRVPDCLVCQEDSRCYRRSVSSSGTGGGFVHIGVTPSSLSSTSSCPHLLERSISHLVEETSFCSGDARLVAFPHIVGYYEVSSVLGVGTTAAAITTPGNNFGGSGSSGLNRGIEHLKTAICELAMKLIGENREIPRSWVRVAESLRLRRQRENNNDSRHNSWSVVGGPLSTIEEVARIAAAQGVTERQEMLRMLQFFKAQGILLYFPQIADLEDLVILDPAWLARIFTAVQLSRDDSSDERGFIDRSRLCDIWRTTGDYCDDPDETRGNESRDRRIVALLRHFGLCVPVDGTNYELFPSKLPLSDVELDHTVWRPLPDPQRERQVTYCVTFPSVIPPPFFNSFVAAFYSYRSDSPPSSPRPSTPASVSSPSFRPSSPSVVNNCPQLSRYFADKFVDWLRIDRPGCRDCKFTSASSDDVMAEYEETSNGDSRSLYHRILVELIAHRRLIRVTARGSLPCCAIKKVSRIFDRVVRQFEGLVNVSLDSIECPGCIVALQSTSGKDGRSHETHKYSALGLVTSLGQSAVKKNPSDQRQCCSNGHVIPSIRDILCGIIGDWFAHYSPDVAVTSSRPRVSQVIVPQSINCPRLFILLPVSRDGLSSEDSDVHLYASTLVPDGYAVHLLCEFPDGYHVTSALGYRLRKPGEFVRRYGGHVVLALRLLGRLVNSSSVQNDRVTRSVANMSEALIKDLLCKFPALKVAVARENANELRPRDDLSSNHRSVRREELRHHLHLADHKPDVFGPLQRFCYQLTGGGNDIIETQSGVCDRTMWLCDEHIRQLQTASLSFV